LITTGLLGLTWAKETFSSLKLLSLELYVSWLTAVIQCYPTQKPITSMITIAYLTCNLSLHLITSCEYYVPCRTSNHPGIVLQANTAEIGYNGPTH
jgi:hypothetical protein